MAISINRPARAERPAGLLGYDQFQIAYVTNDLDRAMEIFRRHHHIQNWTVFDAGVMRIGLAWTGGQMIELIDTGANHLPLYDDWIDKGGPLVLRHHHFGYFVHSDEEWALLLAQLEADNRHMAMQGDTAMLKVIYVDAPELGHYLEYIFPTEAGKAWFEAVAAN